MQLWSEGAEVGNENFAALAASKKLLKKRRNNYRIAGCSPGSVVFLPRNETVGR